MELMECSATSSTGSDDEVGRVEWIAGSAWSLEQPTQSTRISLSMPGLGLGGVALLSRGPHWLERRFAEGADPLTHLLPLAGPGKFGVAHHRSSKRFKSAERRVRCL